MQADQSTVCSHVIRVRRRLQYYFFVSSRLHSINLDWSKKEHTAATHLRVLFFMCAAFSVERMPSGFRLYKLILISHHPTTLHNN